MKTLLLDNYDSFSHLLWQYLWEVNGERPLLLRNDEWPLARIRAVRFDNIVISPGPGRPDNPADFGICAEVIRAFPDVPILGVCLGHQGLGVFAGAPVGEAPAVRHGKVSRIRHDGRGLFAGLPQGFAAVRYHSLVVRAGALPQGLAVTATAEDDGQVMGLALASRPCYGVQFHPESVGTEHGKALLANFRDLTGGRAAPAAAAAPPGGRSAGSSAAETAETADSGERPAAPNVPIEFRELPWRDPESAFLHFLAEEPAAFWLDSLAAPVPGEPLITYMGTGRILHEARGPALRTLAMGPDGHPIGTPARSGDPFSLLAGNLGPSVTGRLPFPFQGGLVGWLGYELKRHAGGGDLPGTPASDLPDALLLEPTRMLVFDHGAKKAWAFLPPPSAAGTAPVTWGASPECAAPADPSRLDSVPAAVDTAPTDPTSGGAASAETASQDQAAGDRAWLAAVAFAWAAFPEAPPLDLGRHSPSPVPSFPPALPFTLSAPRESYLASIASLRASIRAGESYEACLTNEAAVESDADPLRVYRLLRRINPAPYAAYLRFPQARLLCASPERFLKLDAAGRLECRPIKGTRRRGATVEEDAALAADLAEHPKDRSENLMIVDLVRNDFGKVCALGSVQVPSSMQVEAHPSVFQLVSTITGRLRAECSALDAVRACFPGGSMTGAPKKRTMELLEALEKRPRGVFSGALGWIGRNGALDLGMVIRTLVHTHSGNGSLFRIGCGGAILAESDPEAEFDEALLKAQAPLRALELAATGRSGSWTLRG